MNINIKISVSSLNFFHILFQYIIHMKYNIFQYTLTNGILFIKQQ